MNDITKPMTNIMDETYNKIYAIEGLYSENLSKEYEIKHIIYEGFKKGIDLALGINGQMTKMMMEERDKLVLELQGYKKAKT